MGHYFNKEKTRLGEGRPEMKSKRKKLLAQILVDRQT